MAKVTSSPGRWFAAAAALFLALIPVCWIFAGISYADGDSQTGFAFAFAYPAALVMLAVMCANA